MEGESRVRRSSARVGSSITRNKMPQIKGGGREGGHIIKGRVEISILRGGGNFRKGGGYEKSGNKIIQQGKCMIF